MVIGCASAGFSLHPCAIDLTVQTGNCWVGGCPNGWVWVGKMEMCVGMLFEHFFSLASRDLPKHTTLKSYALRRDFCSKSFPLGKHSPNTTLPLRRAWSNEHPQLIRSCPTARPTSAQLVLAQLVPTSGALRRSHRFYMGVGTAIAAPHPLPS